MKRKKKITSHRSLGDVLIGGTLVICSKQRLKEWDQMIRHYPILKYYCYTESLSKRRKLGVHRLLMFDIILTTFDVS